MNRILLVTLTTCSLLGGCTNASQHRAEVSATAGANLTLAAVQRNVQVGMSGANVLQALGSPNIVSTDDERNEVWVYDRVGTEYVYSESGVGVLSLLGAGSGSAVGGITPRYENKAGANRRSQKTLTIIIHFDDEQRVKDFSYHASQF